MSDRRAVRPHTERLDLGHGLHLVRFVAGGYGVEHRCKEVGDGDRLVCAPELVDHTVAEAGGVITVTPSIACPDCGLHGFITAGRWSPA